MMIKYLGLVFLMVPLVSITSGCGGDNELTVVQPDEAHLKELQAMEDLEKSGGAAVREQK